ncbi:MAG TPA: DNA repair protein RadC [Anaerolineaceae bacterium]|nr:DNA repair protein RadC [Anaerolineaceae bacterium]HPN50650.1 DNA repair protein RadC [Anaerolineaceae bacterium]
MSDSSTYRITDFDESERPRERLAALGAQALTNAELLAILLRVGVKGLNAIQVGQQLLNEFQGLRGLHQASFQDLQSQTGVGPAKAAQIKAAVELGRRLALELPEDRPTIHSPADAAALVQYELSALEQEELWVLLLDTRNRLLRIEKLYRGSLNASTVRVAEVFKCAIRWNSASILVVHNHPSGDPTPSPEDTNLTRTLVSAGKLMDVEVLDHLVIGRGKFISMKERGLGFS